MVSNELQRLAEMTGMSAGPSIRPDWNAVRSALGFDAPGDYKELIDNFGAGALNDYVLLLGPGEPVKLYNLVEHGLYWDGYLKDDWENSSEDIPAALEGRSFTLISWALTEDGVQMFWIAEPGVPAEKWQIAFLDYAGERWEFHQQSTIAILTDLAAREISTSLVPPFEGDEPVEFISYDS